MLSLHPKRNAVSHPRSCSSSASPGSYSFPSRLHGFVYSVHFTDVGHVLLFQHSAQPLKPCFASSTMQPACPASLRSSDDFDSSAENSDLSSGLWPICPPSPGNHPFPSHSLKQRSKTPPHLHFSPSDAPAFTVSLNFRTRKVDNPDTASFASFSIKQQ